MKGKFGYLAPEVTLGQSADRRVDISAAGILLWEMLAGRRLFEGATDVETFQQVRAAVVPDVRKLRSDAGDDVAFVLGGRWLVTRTSATRAPVNWRKI